MAVQLHAPPDAEQQQEFLINWNAGPLGVVFRPDGGQDAPPVVAQLLPQPSVVKMAGVREGDVLISVNGKKTTHLGYEKVLRLLFKEHLPMILHFRSRHIIERGRGRVRTSSSRRRRTTVLPLVETEEKCWPKVPVEDNVPRNLRKTKTRRDDDKEYKSRSIEPGERRRQRKQYSVVWERGSLGISFRAYSSSANVPCVDYINTSRGQGRSMDRICVNDVLVAINGEKTKALGLEKVLRWLHVVDKPVVLRFHASSNRVVLDAANGPLVDPFDALDEEASMQTRRLTVPQPEGEPAPRPPRRNNSVDHVAPHQHKTNQGYFYHSDDDVQSMEPRQYLRDYAAQFETQPIEAREPQNHGQAIDGQAKKRRHSNSSISGYAQDRGLVYGEDDGGPEDVFHSLREPSMLAPRFDVKSDARMMSHRRGQQEDVVSFHRQNQEQLPPARTRARSTVTQQQYALPENKSTQLKFTISTRAARPRLASHDSLATISSSQMSFDEAASVVARATGKSVKECKFGGVSVLDIKEGTMQSKLLYIYAKACLAKQINLDNRIASKDLQPPYTSRNPLGQQSHSNFLSYTILQNDAMVPTYNERNCDASSTSVDEQEDKYKAEATDETDRSITPSNFGFFGHRSGESIQTMQGDISITVSPIADRPFSSIDHSLSVSGDAAISTLHARACVTQTDDFISLSDFAVKDGRVIEHHTTPGLSSTATPVLLTVNSDAGKSMRQQEKLLAVNTTDENCAVETKAETIEECVVVVSGSIKPEDASYYVTRRKDQVLVDQQTESPETVVTLKREHTGNDVHEYTDKMQVAAAHEYENNHDDVANIDSGNERYMAANVASIDGLLDCSLSDGSLDNKESNKYCYADGCHGVSSKICASEKESASTSLDTKVGFVHAREVSKTNEHEDPKTYAKHGKHNESKEYEEHDEDDDFKALSDPLVSTLFHDNPDVCEVLKDKPARVVLVKKSVIDEIQEILCSLQMELHFERHSTVAFGSAASPSRSLPQSWDMEGQNCYRCGTTCELVELNVAEGHEDRRSTVTRSSTTLQGADRLIDDKDTLAEVLRYRSHGSSVTCEDMVHPWPYRLQCSDTSLAILDSNTPKVALTNRSSHRARGFPTTLLHRLETAQPARLSRRFHENRAAVPVASISQAQFVFGCSAVRKRRKAASGRHFDDTRKDGPRWADYVSALWKCPLCLRRWCQRQTYEQLQLENVFLMKMTQSGVVTTSALTVLSDDKDENEFVMSESQGKLWFWSPPGSSICN
uniref:PDZ domain-containing protein n=1 Tax=Hyaloperonospora arabidopsidis (strain Emoy2) TaxID=559515 RepID=M4BZM5_HYAAE